MKKTGFLVLLLALGVAAWVGRGPTIPYELPNDVRLVLADWRNAALSCGEPSVGMPGPMVSWQCTGEFQGVALRTGLEADANGDFSISALAPGGTAAADAASAFAGLLRATSFISTAEPEIERWLISTNAADGVMPVTATTGILRAVVSRHESDGDPRLLVVPLGSTMSLAE